MGYSKLAACRADLGISIQLLELLSLVRIAAARLWNLWVRYHSRWIHQQIPQQRVATDALHDWIHSSCWCH